MVYRGGEEGGDVASSTLKTHTIDDVSFGTTGADVRRITIAGREVIRRIFVTTRDAAWREVLPVETAGVFHAEQRLLELNARYAGDGIDLEWRGEFRVAANGRLTFGVDGLLAHDVGVNRLGVAVLYPTAALVGAELEPRSSEAIGPSVEVTSQPMPQPIVDGHEVGITAAFETLVTRFPDGTRVSVQLEGDLGEIEDQRNYGDDSFKIYQPPLSAGLPYRMPAGPFRRGVTIDVDGLPTDAPPESAARRTAGRLPAISFESSAVEHPLIVASRSATHHDGYLAELNRGSVVSIPGDLRFMVDPTVHSGDRMTIAENIPALSAMLAYADAIAEGEAWPLVALRGAAVGDRSPLAVPVAFAYLTLALESGAAAIEFGADLAPEGSLPAWGALLDLLSGAAAHGVVTAVVDPAEGRYRIEWGHDAVEANVSDSARSSPGRIRLLWPDVELAAIPPFAVGRVTTGDTT
jgi:hypothetical protein